MINKCLYWQLTMTCYDDILCAMLKKAWTTLWCTEHFGSASLCKATENSLFLQGGRAVYVPELWLWSACQLWLTRFLCLLRTLADGPWRRFSARTPWWTETLTTQRRQRISTDLHRQSGLQGAAPVPSQLVCTILYSPSPCVSPPPTPLSSIAVEKPCWCTYLTSVQMHLFEKENETLTYL